MAVPKLVTVGLPQVSAPAVLRADDEGKLPSQDIEAVNLYFRDLAQLLNGKLGLGFGTNFGRAGNLDAQWIHVPAQGTADAEFEVFHGLGRTPVGYLVALQTAAGSLYVSRFEAWTRTKALFKSSATGVEFRIIVF